MADNKVKFLRGTATEYEASTKDNDTFYYTTDDGKLYLGNKEITNGGVTIDDILSDTSKNPVQNKVINAALNNKADLSDIPTELPANGGNADTVDGLHANEIASNPNLLINPDFRINQRGKTSYSTTGYSVDRWKCIGNPATVTPQESGGIVLSSSDEKQRDILQNFEQDFSGQTITLSICLDGKIYSVSGVCQDDMSTWGKQIKIVFSYFIAIIGTYETNQYWLMLRVGSNTSVKIDWVKVELGAIATPFVPPDPATELAKCQYYYKEMNTFRINMAYYEASNNSISWFIPYKAMRAIPTVTIKNKDLNGGDKGLYLNGIPDERFQPTDYNLKWVACFGKSESGVIRINCTVNSSLKDALNSWWNAPLTANAETAGLILDAEL